MAKQQQEETKTSNSTNLYDSYIKGREFRLLLIMLGAISFIVFKDFIFLNKIYLFKDIASDSLNASWPFMVQAVDYIKESGFPSWSFNFGMGQNATSFFLYEPFDLLLFPFGKDNMMFLLGFKEIFKIMLTGILFYKFLQLLSINNLSSLIGALLYCFSGYLILGSAWFIFSFEAFTLAFLLWSFEMLFQKNKWYWFVIPIFLIGIARPFNLWLFGLFLLIYFILRVYQSQKILDKKFILLFIGKVIGVIILGIGLSAPFFLEHLQVMIDSPRGNGPDSFFSKLSSAPMFALVDRPQLGTEVFRFFNNDILGTGLKFAGWQNYLEAPVFYCGILSLLIFPQVFQFINKKLKTVFILVLAVWLLPIIFPYFRQAIWLFSGDYYRMYSLFVAVMLIIYTVLGLRYIFEQKKINVKVLLITALTLIILINFPFFKNTQMVHKSLVYASILFVALYTAIFYLIGKNGDNNNYKTILLLVIGVELTAFSWITVNERDHIKGKDLSQKIGYNDYSVDAVNYIKQHDKSFYRIDKSYYSSPAVHGSLNDALVHNYFGTSSYNSFNQKNYIGYLKTMGLISKVNETESRWAPGLVNRFMLESLNDVKYVMTKTRNNPIWQNAFDSIAKFGDVILLKNKNVLPLGFAYNKYIALSDFDKMSPLQKDFISTKACVVSDGDVAMLSGLQKIDLKDTLNPNLLTFDLIKANFDTLKMQPFNVTSFKQTNIKGSISLNSPQMVYFSIPDDKGWHVTSQGKDLEKHLLTNGMIGIYLANGKHDIEFNYVSPHAKIGKLLAISSFVVFLLFLLFTLFRNKKETTAKA